MATENELRLKPVNWLSQYTGISEGSAKHLEILKVFNDSKLCTRYKMTAKDHWCATAVSAAFIASGLAGTSGSGKLFECVECSCANMIKLAQQQGIWVENDAYVPKVGDVILYDWQDNGVGDNTGWPDHVGIVSSVNGNTFRVIEGNFSDSVGYRNMTVNGKFIRGFITPNYSKFATVTESTPTPVPAPSPAPSTPSTGLNKTCKFKGTVTASSALNVRSWAGTKGTTILRTIKRGVIVEVCDIVKDSDGDDWYYIKESGKYGFVSADYISRQDTTESTPAPAPSPSPAPSNTSSSTGLNKTCKFKGTVTASALNVRSWAGVENKALRTIKKGTVVEVCDEVKAKNGAYWYYIKESGKYGFVSTAYIARI